MSTGLLLSPEYNDQKFLINLEPTARELMNTHLARADEWYPHEFVPWERIQDTDPRVPLKEPDSPLEKALASAIFVNLLTEDNLPYYFDDLQRMTGSEGAWGEWNRRWTAEEGRHSIVIRDYVTVSRLLNLRKLERARMAQVSKGQVPHPETALEGTIYVVLQELATRVAHYNTGRRLQGIGDVEGQKVMNRVGKDENLHYLYYFGIASAALELYPSDVVTTTNHVVQNFDMPGTGIPNFMRHAYRIAMSGIYGVTEFKDNVVKPVLKQWKFENLSGLTPEADQAREQLLGYIAGELTVKSAQEQEKRQKIAA